MARSLSTAEAWTGRLVGGRWRIVSLLDDSGGMANVYLAQDEQLPRTAVVKIPKGAALNDEFRARFARESRIHAQVSNRNVVQVLDGGEEAGTPYLVLKYLPGGNLKAWCERNPAILADPQLHHESWLLPVAQALDAVAAQGIIHRDVKPTNILFDAGGQAYLSDFGIVKAQDDGTLGKTGMLIGTLQFMSPEQCHAEKRHALDGRSDQYGLAVTVYQVLTGWKYPAEDDTAVIYATKFGHSPMKQPRDHDPRIPQAVNDAVMRALSPDRDHRFPSNVEFARAVLAGFTERTQEHEQDDRPWLPSAWLAAAGALVVAGTFGAFLWSGMHGGPQTEGVDPLVVPPPRVTALHVAAPGPLKAGDDLELVASFSRPVTVSGIPRIRFTVGTDPTPRFALFQTGAGSAALTFACAVPADIESEGIDLGAAPSIDLANGTIIDADNQAPAGLELGGSVPADLTDLRIDSRPPRVQAVELPRSRDYRVGETLDFVVRFTEAVTLVGCPELELRLGDAVRRTDSGVRPDGPRLAFRYTIRPDDRTSDGVTVTRLVLEAAQIADHAGNEADTTVAESASESFQVGPAPLPDLVDVTLPSGRMRLLLVTAGRQRIPAESLNAWRQYETFGRPTTVGSDAPFYIGETEVSLAEFVDVVRRPPGGGDTAGTVTPTPDDPRWRRPATDVPWSDAIRFCNALSEREGLRPCYRLEPAGGGGDEPRVVRLADGDGFRLPLPDEWVYASLSNRDLRGMTTGVMEWSDLDSGDAPGKGLPFAHGGWDGGKRNGPTFLLRPGSPDDCGFRVVRSAGTPRPDLP